MFVERIVSNIAKTAVLPSTRIASAAGGCSQTAKAAADIAAASKPLFQDLTQKEFTHAMGILKKIGITRNRNTTKLLELTGAYPISATTEKLRMQILQAMEKCNIKPETLKQLKNAKTCGELRAAIFKFSDEFDKYEINPILKKLKPKHVKSGIPLELEQMFYEKRNLKNTCVKTLHLLFIQPSKNPEVIRIEKFLQNNYGIDVALLNDDLPLAQSVLVAVERAKNLGIPIPSEFIVSHFKIGGEHLRQMGGNGSSVILGSNSMLNFSQKAPIKLTPAVQDLVNRFKKTCGFENWFSTGDPEHIVLHEIMHGSHLPLLSFYTKPIPKRFEKTVRALSGYAASKPGCAHEVLTELNTKKAITGLNAEEEELRNFLLGKT